MQERFKQLLDEKELTATKFAAVIKVNASAMSHILNGRSKPGFDVLDKIGQAFPEVNLNWLISGKGNMYSILPNPKQQQTSIQSSLLFEEENETSPVRTEKRAEPVSQSTAATEIATAIVQAPVNKSIKRIVLFFDDGSFEDYTK